MRFLILIILCLCVYSIVCDAPEPGKKEPKPDHKNKKT